MATTPFRNLEPEHASCIIYVYIWRILFNNPHLEKVNVATRAVRVRTLGGISCETVTGPARAALEQDLSPAGFGGGAPIFEIKSVDSPPCYVF